MLKLQAIGNLGRDAEQKVVNDKIVINFSLAHTEKINGQDKTIWIDCAKWGEKTGILPYLKKGQKVYVEGQPDIRTYQKQDGSTAVSLTLRVAHIELCGQQQSNTTNDAQQPYATGASVISNPLPIDNPADDLPF